MVDAVHQSVLDNIEALQRPIAGAEVRATQLSAAGIHGSLLVADLDGAVLSFGRVAGDFYLEGPLSPDRVVLGVLLSCMRPVTHWASEVESGDLGFFPAGSPQTALYQGSAEYLTLALSEDRLAAFADQNEFRLGRKQLQSEGIIADGKRAFWVGRILSNFLQHSPERFSCPNFAAEVRDRFLGAYLSRLDPETSDSRRDPTRDRKIVNDVIEFTRSSIERGSGIDSICAELAIPRRTLHRAFVSLTGMPPAKFVRNYRLNESRRRLVSRRESVTEAATQCGFSELGKFAAYYRRLFGEAPSATLAGLNAGVRSCVPSMQFG
ncbi:helix-turn-helix domain-containing protein [Bosea sp. TAF32]|uniref:helix-turn-helix domain-containing protein n=1 Tax=Bosea sp. TAF32 TaxID=3237482 RepID=UPI003F8E6BEF